MGKRKIYRNFNKRKKINGTRVITVVLCCCIIGTYICMNIKDKDFLDKLEGVNIVSAIKNINIKEKFTSLFDKDNVITSSNIEEELKEINKDEDKEEENSKVVTIDKVVAYTIQLASLEDKNDSTKIQQIISGYKIPSASMNVNNAEKIQAYISFNQDNVKANLNNTRNYFSDAFISKIEVPMISLEYTEKYSYIKDIGEGVNNLIINFQKESMYWDKNSNDIEEYNKILTERETLLEDLEKNTKKIDYEKMNEFKKGMLSYISKAKQNVLMASKSKNENKGFISKGLLLNSIQEYFVFVESLK